MRNIFQFLIIVFCLFSSSNPLLAQWVQTSGTNSDTVECIAVSGSNLYAGTYDGGSLLLSTNNGASCTTTNIGLTNDPIGAVFVLSTNLFAAAHDGVYVSTNKGTSWKYMGLAYDDAVAFAVCGTNLFAGTISAGVFLSTDVGASWTSVNNGLTNTAVRALAVIDTSLFAGTWGGVFVSTNSGTSWIDGSTILSIHVLSLAVCGGNLFAGTDGGIFLSTNNGASWTKVNTGLTNNYVKALAVFGTNLFAGTNGGVFLSTNSGTTWTAVNTGLTNTVIMCLAISDTTLFAGTYGGGICRRPLSEMVTAVKENDGSVPKSFGLEQNYPNPFNPSTKISYQLPVNCRATLKIYDALGRELATLVNDNESAGYKSVVFDASNLSSGVYFYRLQAGTYSQTKKLLLLK
jgi:hypothetical protein